MEVRLTPDQEAFVRQGIEAGRYQTQDDAIAEALSLWEDRERRRSEFRASLADAKDSIKRGDGRVLTEASVKQLAEEVKHRGQERLEAKRSVPR